MDDNVRAVNVNEIVKQRSDDILLAFQAFKNGRSTRTPMQRLPRHMRRRAMSHNVKRMPRNWRQYAIQSTKKSKHRKKPPSRFYRRRRRFQGGDATILRTHVWHAKRYHMKKISGADFTLPHKRFQKVQRTCIRAAAKGCCVADHSYWKCFRIPINGNEGMLMKFLMDYCRLEKPMNFEYNRCHDLLFYNTKLDEQINNDCFGPIQLRKIELDSQKYFEIAADIRSTISTRLDASNVAFENIPQARITLYGPQALQRIIEALKVTKSNDGNLFDDVLDGALLLKGYWFCLKGTLSKDKQFSFDLIHRNQAPESMIDIVFDQSLQKEVWIKFVHSRCQPLGVTDEQNLRTFYGKFSFPGDCADFVNSSLLPMESKELQNQYYRRPSNRRVKYEKLSADNPFNFNFDSFSKSPSDLVAVKIVPIGKGVPQRYTFIYSEVEEEKIENASDIEMDDESEEEECQPPPSKRLALDEDFMLLQTTPTSEFTKIVPMSRLFEVEIKPKLSRGMKRRAKKKAEKRGELVKKEEEVKKKSTEEFLIPQGTVIGRIVRGLRWSSRHGNKLGLGYCSMAALESIIKNDSIVYFRNPASKRYRKAHITIIHSENRFY